jgi:hypothetical protein
VSDENEKSTGQELGSTHAAKQEHLQKIQLAVTDAMKQYIDLSDRKAG